MVYVYDTSFTGLAAGAVPSTDYRTSLQAAINSAASQGKGLYITQPYGVSFDSNNVALTIPSNSYIKFIGNGAIHALAHNLTDYAMMLIDGVNNVRITNARLDGAKEANSATTGESGMGFSIYNSSNIVLVDPVVVDTWGDGIYIGGSGTPNSAIWITHPVLQGMRRNGISVISANGLRIERPEISNVTGTNPKCGIDFEPNDNTNVLTGINVFSPVTSGCNLGLEFSLQGMVGSTAKVVDINVYDWKDDGSLDTALNRYDLNKGSFSMSGHINVHGVTYVKSNILKDISAPYDNSVTWSLTGENSIT